MTTPWVIMPVLGAPALTEAAINDVLAQTVEPNLLIINQGVDTEFRRRLERIAEFHSPRLFVWSHQPPLPSLAASWNRALQMVWEAGGTEALVINNDLRLRPHTYELLRMALSDQQALFVSAVGVAEEQYRAAAEDDQIMYLADGPQMKLGEPGRRGGPDFSCFLISKEGHQQFPFDEGFIPAYCVTPDTPVLTSRLFWIEIGDIRVGDELLGVDEASTRRTSTGQQRRCYRPARVTHVERRQALCLKITMEDGREVICSTDHRWLVKCPKPNNRPYHWQAASALRTGYRIATPLDVWAHEGTYNEGWLAGICDGEGCLRQRGHNRFEVQIAQKPGTVFELIKATLRKLEIPYTTRVRPENNVGTIEVAVRRHVLRLLGQVRPVRLLDRLSWKDISIFSRSAAMDLEIIDIEPMGEREVVTIETTAKTYLANGMIAHNCEDLDLHRRYMLAGAGDRIFSINLPYWHVDGGSGTLKSFTPEQKAAHEAKIGRSRAHYQKKWGGPVNQERYTIPFDPETDQDGVTTPQLQGMALAEKGAGA